jgi:hypothetical protein
MIVIMHIARKSFLALQIIVESFTEARQMRRNMTGRLENS